MLIFCITSTQSFQLVNICQTNRFKFVNMSNNSADLYNEYATMDNYKLLRPHSV